MEEAELFWSYPWPAFIPRPLLHHSHSKCPAQRPKLLLGSADFLPGPFSHSKKLFIDLGIQRNRPPNPHLPERGFAPVRPPCAALEEIGREAPRSLRPGMRSSPRGRRRKALLPLFPTGQRGHRRGRRGRWTIAFRFCAVYRLSITIIAAHDVATEIHNFIKSWPFGRSLRSQQSPPHPQRGVDLRSIESFATGAISQRSIYENHNRIQSNRT